MSLGAIGGIAAGIGGIGSIAGALGQGKKQGDFRDDQYDDSVEALRRSLQALYGDHLSQGGNPLNLDIATENSPVWNLPGYMDRMGNLLMSANNRQRATQQRFDADTASLQQMLEGQIGRTNSFYDAAVGGVDRRTQGILDTYAGYGRGAEDVIREENRRAARSATSRATGALASRGLGNSTINATAQAGIEQERGYNVSRGLADLQMAQADRMASAQSQGLSAALGLREQQARGLTSQFATLGDTLNRRSAASADMRNQITNADVQRYTYLYDQERSMRNSIQSLYPTINAYFAGGTNPQPGYSPTAEIGGILGGVGTQLGGVALGEYLYRERQN